MKKDTMVERLAKEYQGILRRGMKKTKKHAPRRGIQSPPITPRDDNYWSMYYDWANEHNKAKKVKR